MARRGRRFPLLGRVIAWTSLGASAGTLLGFLALGLSYARHVVTPARRFRETVRVIKLDETTEPPTVTFTRGEDASLPGAHYSYIFEQGRGHARIGRVLAETHGSVTREVASVDRGTLRVGVRGRINGWWFMTPESLGHPFEEVDVDTELGPAKAWIIRPDGASSQTWAIHTHGRGARREETLRGVRAASDLGMVSLVLSYRNDPEAPPALDGAYGFGLHESRDAEAAIDYGVRHGAENIVLFGWSMGGTISLLAAEQSTHRGRILGMVLDSPAVDWSNLLEHHARLNSVPRAAVRTALWLLRYAHRLVGLTDAVDISSLSPERFARELSIPVLIHSSPGDTYVPDEPVQRLKELSPDLVTWHRYGAGEHVRLWNVDPEKWEETTKKFLHRLCAIDD